MSIEIFTSLGSNRASCLICKKKILLNEIQIAAIGYRSSRRVHLRCVIEQGEDWKKKGGIL